MEIIENIGNLPALDVNAIHIWGVHVSGMLDRIDDLHDLLSTRERDKAARFHREADRQSSIAARGALRVLLSGYTGISAAEIEFRYSEYGKPSLVVPQASRLPVGAGSGSRRAACDTISFNVSHSGDWVVLAFGNNRHVGVDIERIKWDMDVLSIASRYFTPNEQALIESAGDPYTMFFQLWARKEAYVKACGSTLFSELKRVSVPMEEGEEKDGWYFHYLEAGSKYAAAVVTDKRMETMPCYDFGGLKWQN